MGRKYKDHVEFTNVTFDYVDKDVLDHASDFLSAMRRVFEDYDVKSIEVKEGAELYIGFDEDDPEHFTVNGSDITFDGEDE